MNEQRRISGARRHRRKLLVLLILLAVAAASWMYLHSDPFKEMVKNKVTAELERATGGRVEMGRFTWSVSELGVAGEDVTIHGLEGKDEPPLAHADRVVVQAKVFSWIGRDFGLRNIELTRPVVHITVNPDGTSNVPSPGRARTSGGPQPIDTLFRLQIDNLVIEDGSVAWNHERIPLAMTATNVRAGLNYIAVDDRYEGKLSAGSAALRYKSAEPVALRSELSFNLFQNHLELTSLVLETKLSRIEGEGKIPDLRTPVLDLRYRGNLEMLEWTPLLATRNVRAGNATVAGNASLSADAYNIQTQATVRSLEFQHGNILVRGVAAAALVAFDGEKLTVRNLVAQTLGGVVKGEATLSGLEAGSQQQGTIKLDVARLDLPVVLAAAPIDVLAGMPLTGRVSGHVTADWRGEPENTLADFDLRLERPLSSAAEQLPVSGQIRGKFAMRGERLELAQADLATPGTTAHMTGMLGGERAQMSVTIETTRLAEFDPVIRNIAGERGIPLKVQGKAAFRGTISGALKAPAVKGNLQLTDFDSVLAPAVAAKAPTSIHWDTLRADIDYSQQTFAISNGQLRRRAAAIDASGAVSLFKGRFTDLSTFQMQSRIHNVDLADVQTIAGTQYPISGVLNGEFRLGGTKSSPRGNGKLRVDDASLYGEAVRTFTADLRLEGRQVSAENIIVAENGGRLTGSGRYRSDTERFAFTASGSGFDLAHFKSLENSYATLGGVASLSAAGEGTLAQPTINGKLKIENFSVNGEALGDFTAQASTSGRELRLEAQTEFRTSSLKLNGTAQLTGDFPARGTVQLSDFHLDSRTVPRIAGKVNGSISANGTFDFAGPLKNPRAMTLKGEIPTAVAVIENIQLTNDGPIVFAVSDQALTLQQFHVKGEGTNLQATGTIGLTGDQKMNFRAQGEANLRLFQGFNRDLQSYGNLVLSTSVGGTLAKPELAGQIQIQNGGVAFIDLPNGLSEINGVFVFDQNRLRIQSLSAKSGGGLLNIGGYIAYRNGLYFDLTAKGDDIRLRYPEGVSSVANADLHLTGTTRSSLLAGDVLVTKFGINPRFDFALYLARSRQVEDSRAQKNPVLDSMRLDIHVITTADLRVETSLAKLAGDADLRIRGTAADPAVLGRINIVEGNIFFSGTQYNLERGDILFINPRGIDPVLNLEATARVREYDITIGFHGKPTGLSTTYRSEPPLPSADIIALLALGRTRDDTRLTNTPEQSLTETAQNAILGQALDAAISNRVQRLFGVSRIKIDPQVGGPENATARVTIEQQVNNNVTLTYITNLSSANQQIIQAEFNVNRNVSVVVVRDQNGVLGFDVKVRQRKR
jgi:translocation and assembly module TamB